MRNRAIDVNSLLQGANVVVAILLLAALATGMRNDYLDSTTLGLGLLLCLQTQLALMLERVRRDPFVVMLSFSMIAFYSLRIFTLAITPYSLVFDRFGFSADGTNFALGFMIVANTLMYAGLGVSKLGQQRAIDASDWKPTAPGVVVALMIVTLLLAYSSGNYLSEMPRAVAVLVVFLSPPIIISMSLAYVLVFRRGLSRTAVIAISALLILETLAHSLWGSRSAIPEFLQTLLLIGLAVFGQVSVKRRYVVLGIGLMPVFGALLVAVFAVSTYNRVMRVAEGGRALDVAFALKTVREGGAQLADQALDVVLPPVLARAGYFDFSAEVIAHRDIYRSVVNPPAYGRSIIDNLLTPGFDMFDQPLMANAIRFLYANHGPPSKQAVGEAYHSDQIGGYGELFTLFGYGSLPLFLFIPFVLKRVYTQLRSANPLTLAMKRIIVLSLFPQLINSFGFDWIVVQTVPFVIAVAGYSLLFTARRMPAPAALPQHGLANA